MDGDKLFSSLIIVCDQLVTEEKKTDLWACKRVRGGNRPCEPKKGAEPEAAARKQRTGNRISFFQSPEQSWRGVWQEEGPPFHRSGKNTKGSKLKIFGKGWVMEEWWYTIFAFSEQTLNIPAQHSFIIWLQSLCFLCEARKGLEDSHLARYGTFNLEI